ncbi:hypothetical protein [Novosphingobium resinovorum]|uniref:Uncharacterized protein n=1 Tax=Novosphingobium resinovorum TaxID=158500 RepID=A0A1D8A506_9SPHN|nr:hypothetical protein [Novosphingobium resinovorum]AOR77188.1 hypothetical protein BES08_10835 [Novosphingobium resinovorum]
MSKPASFFIVWNPEGHRPPRYRHEEFARAEREAKRLAAEQPGQQFFVMEARVMATRPDPVVLQEFENYEDGIPF